MSSRFFMYSESESSSDSEAIVKEPIGLSAGINTFAFSDDEEDQKRVVRSAKEKRYEELNNIIKNIKNFKKNKDMTSLLTGFEHLCKAYQKALNVVMKEEGGRVPRFFVRCLVELEDYVTIAWQDVEGRKSMSKNNAKSLTSLRQKHRKYIKDYEKDIELFRNNPDADDSEGEKDDHEKDEEEPIIEPIKEFKKETSLLKEDEKKPYDADDESDDSFDWGSDSGDSSSSSEDEKKFLNTRERFLKKVTTTIDDETQQGDRKSKVKRRNVPREEKAEDDENKSEWHRVSGKKCAIMTEKPKMFGKDDEITIPSVVKKLTEIMAARGKKGTDRREQIELLHELFNISKDNNLGDPVAIKIQFSIIMSLYDYNPSISEPMKVDFWEKILIKLEELLNMLINNPELTVGEQITDDSESLAEEPFSVRGCVLTIIERMDDEFIKLLKACDSHSNEYVVRLRDEVQTCALIDKLMKYVEEHGSPSDICRIYLRTIEHLYYKYDKLAMEQKETDPTNEKSSLKIMNQRCNYIYRNDTTDRLRTRAVLCHIYHMSLHDEWYKARDLMLMAHLQDTIQHSDLPTQILYNRTMVQLGLCAFRHGSIKDAHNCLLDIQSGGRAKELLAQGLLPQRQHERTTEQEKQEKQRQIPFHMHINLEMLECVYLVSAMLIEIPYMAAHEFDARRRMISKSFHHQLKNSERQSLVGAPESMREHVVAASKAMRNGNWRTCRNLLINEKMNNKVWDLFHKADAVRTMLGKKVQEESLRTYLFTYSKVYDSISLEKLSLMLELVYRDVHAVISKMIINEEIMASLDEPTSCLMMHRTEPSSMQSLSLQCSDKLYNLVENNERILDQKPFFTRGAQHQGGGGYRDHRQKNWNDQKNWTDRRDRRDNRRGNDRDRD